ncbi:MAG TPA: prepilin-type N-terminal cleavage/methylation domain-containing protein [Pyrinomonadaceae bacterium]|nr:prepilin-type N-terminal cleavage/methylation domain-containing protein [Pyrinomonadaceae bacterium]
MRHTAHVKRQAGFSLMELLVAMTVMIFIAGAATTLLVSAFNTRSREDQRSEAISDARRALNIITREVANSGYLLPRGLTYSAPGGTKLVPVNGLLPEDCDATGLTFVANLNAQGEVTNPAAAPSNSIGDGVEDEVVKFQFVQNGADSFLVRRSVTTGDSLVLANRIDGARFDYLNAAGNDTSADLARAVSIRVTVWVTLSARGKPGTAGYQAPGQVNLSSLINLRNAHLDTY